MMQKNTRRGFTLIELLVVILIIGILAAVAVPQYKKAVEKSKATQGLTLLKSLAQAQKIYYLANGTYATKFEQLDVDMPGWTGNTRWSLSAYITDTRSNDDWSLQILKWQNVWQMYAARISGSYQGAGFVVDLPEENIICAERRSNGIRYTLKDNSYCTGIMKATALPEDGSTFRTYELHP